ncbi:hypothetical protein [Dehalogenimonas alkenigignens]|uniref:hypothetical protein n=1 Tax=Dehalogenimonas alkenigignens TaxID=1217799 RepID=UPI000D573187|nr:hypothetical protein [Dehalogenimonas alkenigignens]PVV83518.1 hypothetical protein DD509_06725 [Dehalogenimonas alkenigignens]
MAVYLGFMEEKQQQRTKRIPLKTIGPAQARLLGLKDDVQLILSYYQRTPSALARSLNISRYSVLAWKKGKYYPKEPLHVLAIMLCAEEIRAKLSSAEAS